MSSVSLSKYIGIDQREWGITNSTSPTPCIGAPGVASCIAMIVQAPIFKTAAIAHLDNGTAKKENVDKILAEMSKISRHEDLVVTFIGGWKTTASINTFVRNLIHSWKEKNFCQINDQLLFSKDLGDGYPYVWVDTRDGTVHAEDQIPEEFSNAERINDIPLGQLRSPSLIQSVDARRPIRLELHPSIKDEVLNR
ncbi:MAG TPA: hypothetical protein VLE89_04350 [Chlamydiales bacterium]|nr:hypothetical protein [Chlamydiales bacterium]